MNRHKGACFLDLIREVIPTRLTEDLEFKTNLGLNSNILYDIFSGGKRVETGKKSAG